jgi:hypothetical protein
MIRVVRRTGYQQAPYSPESRFRLTAAASASFIQSAARRSPPPCRPGWATHAAFRFCPEPLGVLSGMADLFA